MYDEIDTKSFKEKKYNVFLGNSFKILPIVSYSFQFLKFPNSNDDNVTFDELYVDRNSSYKWGQRGSMARNNTKVRNNEIA